jgi:hypothetical protein
MRCLVCASSLTADHVGGLQGTGRRRLCLRTMTAVRMTAGFDTEATAAMAEAYDKASDPCTIGVNRSSLGR